MRSACSMQWRGKKHKNFILYPIRKRQLSLILANVSDLLSDENCQVKLYTYIWSHSSQERPSLKMPCYLTTWNFYFGLENGIFFIALHKFKA